MDANKARIKIRSTGTTNHAKVKIVFFSFKTKFLNEDFFDLEYIKENIRE